MRHFLGLLALLCCAGGRVWAAFCAQDAAPAATLLFPYIEVSVSPNGTVDPAGQTTISHIVNVGSQTVVVHFTVWDLVGVPRFTFDEILSGYDALLINWRDVVSGRGDLFDTSRSDFTATLPLTRDPHEWGPDGRYQDGGLTTPENRSAVSGAQCPGPPPHGDRSDLAPVIFSLLRGSQLAREEIPCQGNRPRAELISAAHLLNASRLVFYATADVVSTCTTLFPSDPAYWGGVALPANVLTGQLVFLNARARASEMMPAVHVEASAASGAVAGFYEEKTAGAKTGREPLATAFAFPYRNDQVVQTNLIFWKNFDELDRLDDPAAGVWGNPSDCGSYVYYAWDMDERSLSFQRYGEDGVARYDPNQLPFATQKVPLTREYFDLPGEAGWMLVVLPPSYGSAFVDPTPDGKGWLQRPYMGWAAFQIVYGDYSAGSEATTMANALCDPTQTLPHLGVATVPHSKEEK